MTKSSEQNRTILSQCSCNKVYTTSLSLLEEPRRRVIFSKSVADNEPTKPQTAKSQGKEADCSPEVGVCSQAGSSGVMGRQGSAHGHWKGFCSLSMGRSCGPHGRLSQLCIWLTLKGSALGIPWDDAVTQDRRGKKAR